MAGKHRKAHRRKSSGQRYWASTLAVAAVGATSLTTALSIGTTVAVAPAVELTALITPASSTAQVVAGTTFYGVNYSQQGYGPQQVVPFFLGPQGIVDAIQNSDDPTAVLSSGWGAGQTGTAVAMLANDPALDNVKLVILDNNSNRAGGGFWTTYWMFAPLLGTSAEPTSDETSVPTVLDVAYEYNINSSAPTNPGNLLADVNSLVAYVYGYANQSVISLPSDSEPEGLKPGTHYIVRKDGTVDEIPVGGTTTYVTYESDRLPLVKPLLLVPGGEIVADLVEPALTVLVNAGYKDNQPIPMNPRDARPMNLMSTSETATALQQLPDAIQEGVQAARDDLTSTANSSTNTLARGRNSQRPSIASQPTPLTSPFDTENGLKPGSGGTKTSRVSTTDATKPIRQVRHNVRAALDDMADSLTKRAQRFSNTGTPSASWQSPAATDAPKKARPPATRP
jgi:PE-PPE domain